MIAISQLANQPTQPQSFDTRFAAATSLKSFFTRSRIPTWDANYLPVLSALYDSLVDDDDEVRETAAIAASAVIGSCAVAPTAADELVLWLGERFAGEDEFKARVVCRMVGQAYGSSSGLSLEALVPAEEQLRKAMDFDDSLFAAEEQNLFIDEVRETARWRKAFEKLGQSGSSEAPSFSCLRTWSEAGLKAVIGLADNLNEDGPLGWTSDQHVFAVCARVLLCAVALARVQVGEDVRIAELLKEFVGLGEKTRMHGSLLEMARLA